MLDGDNAKTLVSQGVGGRQHGCWTDDLFLLAGSPSRASGSSQVLPIVPGGLGLTPAVPKPSPYFAYADYARLLANPKSPCKQQGGLGVRGDLSDVDQPALGRQGHGLGAAD